MYDGILRPILNYATARQIGRRSGAEEAAPGMPRMPWAGGRNLGTRVDSRHGDHRGSLSLGVLSWRKISHSAVLAGLGKLHANSGDYVLLVQMEPSPRGSRVYLSSDLRGLAYLCTPRGERIRLHLGGAMRAHLNLSTDGEAINLYVNYWPLWYGQFIADRRPSLDFRGHWQNPNLVMDDHGSISNAFQPDGSVYDGHDRNRPYSTEIVPITLVEGSYSQFNAACATVHR